MNERDINRAIAHDMAEAVCIDLIRQVENQIDTFISEWQHEIANKLKKVLQDMKNWACKDY